MIRTAYSQSQTLEGVVEDIRNGFAGGHPLLIVYFASTRYPPSELAAALQAAYPDAQSLGCTTAGEIAAGKMFEGAVVAMALTSEALADVALCTIPDLDNVDMAARIRELESRLRGKKGFVDPQDHVGLILSDGMAACEEFLMSEIHRHTDITFIGGSAGDDLGFRQTFVFANGIALSGAAVMAILRPRHGFDFIKTQSFAVRGESVLVATRCDPVERVVHEFNGEPARLAYARALGIDPGLAHEMFQSHPLGLLDNAELYVRSPKLFEGDSLHFYCGIHQGTRLHLLSSTDIVADTERAIAEKVDETCGRIAGLINFHCILRTLELRKTQSEGRYGALFERFPTIGFSTYGEQLFWHVNQTATMLLFLKSPRRVAR